MSELDLGLLLLRLMLAALLLGHAVQKSLGWLGGNGVAKTAEVFESWGFRPGRLMVLLAAGCELVGALSVGSGLLFRLGCAVLIGTLIVAATPAAEANGLWAQRGGCEVPATYAGVAVCLAVAGPGDAALDHAIGIGDGGWTGAVAALVVGVLAAVPPLANRRRLLRVSAS
jgi:putative oxidoreductase